MKLRERYIKDEHLEFLDELRESGVNPNISQIRLFVRDEFPDLSNKEAIEVVMYWMANI